MEIFILHFLVGTISSMFLYGIFLYATHTEKTSLPTAPFLIGFFCGMFSFYISHYATILILILFALSLVREYQLGKIYFIKEEKKERHTHWHEKNL